MADGSNPKKTLEEIPLDAIRDAMANYEQVNIRVTRRNDRGQIATVYGDVIRETAELADIDEWLRSNAGGGRFRIEARDPNDKTRYVLPPFHVTVEGPPRPPRYLGHPTEASAGPGAYGPSGAYPPVGMENQHMSYQGKPPSSYQQPQPFYGHPDPHDAPPPAWLAGVHPSLRSGYVFPRSTPSSGNDSRAPGATIASDALALRQLEQQRSEAQTQIAKLEAQNHALQEKLDRMLEELKGERERAREERHRLELEALKKEMLSSRKPEENATDWTKMAAAMAPFAPVLAALVQSREQSSSKALELQQAGLQSLMQATLSQANKPNGLTELLPIVMPMVKELMEAKSPKAQAELYNSMVENNLNSVAMMAQLVEAFASSGKEEPWYLPMIRETLSGVVGMTEAYMQGKGLPGQRGEELRRLAAPQQAAQHAPQQAQTAQAPQVGTATYSTFDDVEPEPQPAAVQQKRVSVRRQPITPPSPAPAQTPEVVAGPPVDALDMDAEVDEDDQPEDLSAIERELRESAKPSHRMLLTMLPGDYQTLEWRIILLRMHAADEDAEDIAETLAAYLAELHEAGTLPESLADLAQDPARALDRVFAFLPISREEPAYAAAVIRSTIERLLSAGLVEQPEPLAIAVGA